MPAPKPTVSIVIPAYNVEPYLAKALESVRAQTLTDWELFVVDDGSTDGTLAVARQYAELDPRIQVLEQANAGPSAARNTGIARASAEVITLLDADDQWDPEKLEKQLACLHEQGADLVYHRFRTCDLSGRITELVSQLPSGLTQGQSLFSLCYTTFFVWPSTTMFRAETLHRSGRFDGTLRACEDWELWLRLSSQGYKFYGMEDVLATYLHRPDGLSQQAMFEPAVAMLPRYSDSPWLAEKDRVKPYRVLFRNAFTFLGRLQQVDRADHLFDLYRPHDKDGIACRVMGALRRFLPRYLFWFVCRFAVIPLAWHLEAFGEREPQKA